MTEKRFQVETDEGFVVSLKDNLAKKYPFSLACESVDDYENVIDEVMSCGVLLNQLWEQTQRFEKHNQRLEKENEQLKKELQRMYDVATLNKAIEVLENKYDKMLSDGSDEVKDAMRHTVLRCIEDLDELKDDITAR